MSSFLLTATSCPRLSGLSGMVVLENSLLHTRGHENRRFNIQADNCGSSSSQIVTERPAPLTSFAAPRRAFPCLSAPAHPATRASAHQPSHPMLQVPRLQYQAYTALGEEGDMGLAYDLSSDVILHVLSPLGRLLQLALLLLIHRTTGQQCQGSEVSRGHN